MPAQFADSQYRSVRSFGRAMVNAALLLTVLSVSADLLANDRPPPQDQPTQVSLGLYLLDVLDIDDSEQMITIDFGLPASWVDPRVKDKAGQTFRSVLSGPRICRWWLKKISDSPDRMCFTSQRVDRPFKRQW